MVINIEDLKKLANRHWSRKSLAELDDGLAEAIRIIDEKIEAHAEFAKDVGQLIEMAREVVRGIDDWNQAVSQIVDVSHLPKWKGLEDLRTMIAEFERHGY